MDAEDDEARAETFPPLQQHSDAPTTALHSDTDAGEHVITGEVSEPASVDDVVGVVKEDDSDVAEVAPEAVNETVAEETQVVGDSEKENESGSVDGDGLEDEAMDRNGDGNERVVEGTDVYDVAVEEEETDLGVGQEETNDDEIRDAEMAEEMDEANEAALLEEQEGQEEEEEEEEEDDDADEGMENEVALMEEDQEIHAEEEDEEIRAEDEDEEIRAEDEDEEIRADEEDEEIQAEEGDEEIRAEEEEEENPTAADVIEAAEEMEEQGRSVSGGKRKRGAGKIPKSAGRVPSRKKMEEDVCFICFDGGDLVLCDRRWECRQIFSTSNTCNL